MIVNDQQLALERYLGEPTIENRNRLVDAYHYLCQRGARKFFRDTVERSDLMQVGVTGLIKAADRYRADFGTPFEAYAWLMVVGELMHYVRDYEALVRIPRWMRSFVPRSTGQPVATQCARTEHARTGDRDRHKRRAGRRIPANA